jgi:hypothetical protein
VLLAFRQRPVLSAFRQLPALSAFRQRPVLLALRQLLLRLSVSARLRPQPRPLPLELSVLLLLQLPLRSALVSRRPQPLNPVSDSVELQRRSEDSEECRRRAQLHHQLLRNLKTSLFYNFFYNQKIVTTFNLFGMFTNLCFQRLVLVIWR